RPRRVGPVQNGQGWITKNGSQPPLQLAGGGVPSELDHEAAGPGVLLLGLQLARDESDRHDTELLGGVEEPAARLLPRGIRLEDDLTEPGERILHVRLVVDRQPAASARVDVRERSVREARSLFRVEAGHAATIARFPRPREPVRTLHSAASRYFDRAEGSPDLQRHGPRSAADQAATATTT